MLGSLVTGGAISAAVYAGIGLAPDAAVVAGLLAAQGFGVTMWNVVTVSLRQQVVPARLLGRVNSVYRMLGWGLMPVGALEIVNEAAFELAGDPATEGSDPVEVNTDVAKELL